MTSKRSIILLIVITIISIYSCTNNKKASSYKNYDDFETINPDFKLYSKAVANGELLDNFKCEEKINDVENSIPLSWSNVPQGTNSLAIVMYHYPKKNDKTEVNSYLLLWGIDPSVTEIPYKMANNPNWAMGSNKDGTAISYTSPCSRGPGKHEYTIALFALKEAPKSLPKENSINVDYTTFMEAISEVDVIDRTTLTFTDSRK